MSSRTITAEDLGITVERKERPLFQWFLASYLLGKRIQQHVARQTWEIFIKEGIDTPQRIAGQSVQQVVDIFGRGDYRRHDESTAHHLLDMARTLVREHHGNLLNMYDECGDDKEFKKRLQTLKGVGPMTTDIFMREAQPGLIQVDDRR